MKNQYYMRYCPICAKNKTDLNATYHVHGYIDESIFVLKDNKCLLGHDTIQLSMPCEDYEILTQISTDPEFMDAMVRLCDTNPIEYQLKMSQFKANLSQQEQIKQQAEENSKPHCPHCKSTNIKPISGLNRGASIAVWGIFSKKINKSFECKNCGYTW